MDRQQMVHPVEELEQVTDANEVLRLQTAVKAIYVDPLIKQYIVEIVEAHASTRRPTLAPRRAVRSRCSASQAFAMLTGRDFVIPDDVKALAYSTLGHRVIVSPSARVKNISAADIVNDCLSRVPVPGSRARGAFSAG